MKQLLPLLLFAVVGCSMSQRQPSSTSSTSARLDTVVEKLAEIETDVKNWNSGNCPSKLDNVSNFFSDWMPHSNDLDKLKSQGPELLARFFKTRLAIHNHMGNFSENCLVKLKDVFRNMRASEDIIGVMTYDDKQMNAEDIKFNKQPIPLVEKEKYRPYQFNPAVTDGKNLQFKKGDLMITKGISLISSTISSVPKQPSLFSHIVFVYQDQKTQDYGTIESYIGKGVSLFSMKDALQNENARILMLRMKDQNIAEKGHDYMLARVQKSIRDKKPIPYDYNQDFNDNSKLSCEEIAYDAFKSASNGQMLIPLVPTTIQVNDEDFVKNAGLKNGPLMMPADMEVDPRFELVLDWTDYRLMRDSWRKDAILSEVIRWINDEDYRLSNQFTATAAKLIWKTREIKFLWPTLSKLAGLPTDFEKEVPASGIALMANLKALGPKILPKLAAADQNQFKMTGRWMSREELRSFLNALRISDLERFKRTGQADFHYFFRPKNLRYQPDGN